MMKGKRTIARWRRRRQARRVLHMVVTREKRRAS